MFSQISVTAIPHLEELTKGGPLERRYSDLIGFQSALKSFTIVNACSALEAFLYGIHCILFVICVFILAKKRNTTSMIFLAAAIVMFGLSTGDFALTLRMQLADIPKFLQGRMGLDEVIRRGVPKAQLFIANNLVADLLLLYRCFMVWSLHKSILAIAVLLFLADTVFGWVGAGTSKSYFQVAWGKFTIAYYWSIFCVNIVMTILIAGRLWWITERSKPRLGSRDLRPFQNVIVVFAETALIYSACVLIAIVIPKPNSYAGIIGVVVARLVSIMPTLLIVQIAGGRSIGQRRRKSAVEDIGHPGSTQGTRLALDTMVTTRSAAVDIEAQEVLSEGGRPSGAGPSV